MQGKGAQKQFSIGPYSNGVRPSWKFGNSLTLFLTALPLRAFPAELLILLAPYLIRPESSALAVFPGASLSWTYTLNGASAWFAECDWLFLPSLSWEGWLTLDSIDFIFAISFLNESISPSQIFLTEKKAYLWRLRIESSSEAISMSFWKREWECVHNTAWMRGPISVRGRRSDSSLLIKVLTSGFGLVRNSTFLGLLEEQSDRLRLDQGERRGSQSSPYTKYRGVP